MYKERDTLGGPLVLQMIHPANTTQTSLLLTPMIRSYCKLIVKSLVAYSFFMIYYYNTYVMHLNELCDEAY